MTEQRVTPLRQRVIEDMNIRGLGDKTQEAHIRNVKRCCHVNQPKVAGALIWAPPRVERQVNGGVRVGR